MKIQVQQGDLARSLGAVASVVSTRATLPILSTILFEANGKELTLAATDLDVSIVTRVSEVQVEKAGRVAVPAGKFVPFVRALGTQPLTVEATGDKIRVRSGKARLEEPCMSPEDFPALPKVKDAPSFTISGQLLAEMIDATIYATSRDETRPALQGVLWEIAAKGFSMVATDGHRLSRIRRQLDSKVPDARKFIASSPGLGHVMRLCEGVPTVTVYLGEHQLSFELGPTLVHTRLVEGAFPNYEQVIPRNNERRVICDRVLLAETVRRVKISADRVTNQIRFGIAPGAITLSAAGTEGSLAEDELAVEYAGDPLAIGFNHAYVEDILKHMRTEHVLMAVDRPDAAAIFVPGEDLKTEPSGCDDLCLLMPLRLND